MEKTVIVKGLTFNDKLELRKREVKITHTKGVGIHVIGIADEYVSSTLLTIVTGLQAKGVKIPSGKIIIQYKDMEPHDRIGLLDAAVVAGLVALAGNDPDIYLKLEDYTFIGQFTTSGELETLSGNECRAYFSQYKELGLEFGPVMLPNILALHCHHPFLV